MKIVLCANCADVFAPNRNETRSCACNKTWAFYDDAYILRLSPSEYSQVIELDYASIVDFLNGVPGSSEMSVHFIKGNDGGVNRYVQ